MFLKGLFSSPREEVSKVLSTVGEGQETRGLPLLSKLQKGMGRELVPSTMPQEVLFSSNLTLKSPGPHPAFCCTYVCNERCSGICFSRHRVYVPGGPSTPFTSKPQSCSSPGFSEAEPCLQAHSYICSGCSPEAIAQLGTALPT